MQYYLKRLNNQIVIEEALTQKEKEKIYRFRYQIYVQEMTKELSNADHRRQMLFDDMDEWGVLFYARIGKEIVGTTRINLGNKKDFSPELIQAFDFDKFASFDTNSSFPLSLSSKTMVTSRYRRSQAFSLLMTAMYNAAHKRGTHFIFGGSAAGLIPLYEHMGFRLYKDNFTVPEYGYMIPFVILVKDMEHLSKVRSPFYNEIQNLNSSPNSIVWFSQQFPDSTSRYTNRYLTDHTAFWQILTHKLGQPPDKAISLFQGFNESEAQLCANLGHLISCRKNDIIVHPYNISEEIYIVVSGILTTIREFSGHEQKLSILQSGQSFGEQTFDDYVRQETTIIAKTDANILLIPQRRIAQLEIQHPKIALKLWRNIAKVNSKIAMYA